MWTAPFTRCGPGVKRFLYAASSTCYGLPDAFPTREDAVIQPQCPYALTKYLGEVITMHWGQFYKLPVISLRMFNVYGPRARTSGTYGAVFGVFLAQMLADEPVITEATKGWFKYLGRGLQPSRR